MIKAPIFSKEGKSVGELELNPEVFGARVNHRLLQLALAAYAGNLRRGTHDTRRRAEVRGGGKKPWKQKGTGRARHGSRRSPIWRGGGTVFGPHPREYGSDLNSQMKRKALISALSLKQKSNDLLFIEDAQLLQGKTKELAKIVQALGLDKTRTLFVVGKVDENLKRASRNLKERFSVRVASDVNSYHIQRRVKLLIEKSALVTIEQRALNGESAADAGEQQS